MRTSNYERTHIYIYICAWFNFRYLQSHHRTPGWRNGYQQLKENAKSLSPWLIYSYRTSCVGYHSTLCSISAQSDQISCQTWCIRLPFIWHTLILLLIRFCTHSAVWNFEQHFIKLYCVENLSDDLWWFNSKNRYLRFVCPLWRTDGSTPISRFNNFAIMHINHIRWSGFNKVLRWVIKIHSIDINFSKWLLLNCYAWIIVFDSMHSGRYAFRIKNWPPKKGAFKDFDNMRKVKSYACKKMSLLTSKMQVHL